MDVIAAKATNAELFERASQLGTEITQREGALLEVIGELDRRQAFREEGATSIVTWLANHLGIAESTARRWVDLAHRLYELPQLAQAVQSGEVSVDKARPAADLAAASNALHADGNAVDQARQCSPRQLAELARSARGAPEAMASQHYERRYLRWNDTRRTISAQLPEDDYVLVRNVLAREAEGVRSDGETPYDQRLADALVRLCQRRGRGTGTGTGTSPTRGRNTDPHIVVHADLLLLRGAAGRAELERLGLLSREAAKRLACNATVALAVDDAFGHTMAEGRAVRFPTDQQRREVWRRDRTCRFPGCANSLFTNVHHIVHWAEGGTTDLENLVLLCNHHHHTVHEKRWEVSGNANGKLQFLGPTKQLLTSRPSPLWTRRN